MHVIISHILIIARWKIFETTTKIYLNRNKEEKTTTRRTNHFDLYSKIFLRNFCKLKMTQILKEMNAVS
jgi:hypothetical protein